MRKVLYTILGILVGIVGGGVTIESVTPNASRPVVLVLWTITIVVFGIAGFLLARKIDNFDRTPTASFRLNLIILGLLSVVWLGFAIVGMVQFGPQLGIFRLWSLWF